MTTGIYGFDASKFTDLIKEHQSIVITTHVNPDGDALGSEVGLAQWLQSIGKTVRVINHSPTPSNYTFLDKEGKLIEVYNAEKHTELIRSFDMIIVLDVNDPSRTKSLGPFLIKAKSTVIVVDHHLEPKEFADHYFIDTEACSTGELIVRLIESSKPILGGTISVKAAEALYVAIMTDTGNFKFPRTTSSVFRMCADLIDLGADPVTSYDEVYNSSPASRLLLIRECMSSLEYHYDNQMAFQALSQSQLASTKSNEEDVDGFVQIPFQVKGIVLSVFLLELKDGWKISFRSKGNVSAAGLAQRFGGNGHFNAAGARVFEKLPFDKIKSQIIHNAEEILIAAKEHIGEVAQ